MSYSGYGYQTPSASGYGAAGQTLLGHTAESITLIMIALSFLLITYLAVRSRTVRSFQFEMFLFTLVLMFAEVPRILMSVGFEGFSGYGEIGLEVHSASMVILVGFVAFRTYRFLRR